MPYRIVYVDRADHLGFEHDYPQFLDELEIDKSELHLTFEHLSTKIHQLHNVQRLAIK
jgi:hypothetical protein